MALQFTPNPRATGNLSLAANQRARMSSIVSMDWDNVIGRPDLDLYVPYADVLQEVTTSSGAIATTTTLLAVVRSAPASTALTLPPVLSVPDGWRISIIDWSTGVTDHAITLTPNGTQTIMKAATWPIYSNSAQLASVTFRASQDLDGWYIAP